MFGPSRTYLGLPPTEPGYAAARAVVLPVPYDATTSYRAGARDGARAIIAASTQLELYDADLDREPAEVGIHTLDELEPDFAAPARMVARVRDATARLLADGKFPLLLGGEHSLTPGAVAACRERWPDLGVLHLDAHADLRDAYQGTPQSHACAIRRVLDLGCPVASVGIRSLSSEEAAYRRDARGLTTIAAAEVARARHSPADLDALWTRAVAALPATIYVTVDLDVFDPAFMAAVGTPEPGGLDWWEVTGLLRRACAARRVVGADIVELAPAEGPVACAFAAAKLAYTLVGHALASDER
ncbi:MAG TPA: agmatinase [Thermomicrobiales bacterium]|nr:agmatinase [Thermomicrobiales bacterium]